MNKLLIILVLFLSYSSFSQLGDDLYIFGSMQGIFLNEKYDSENSVFQKRPVRGDTTLAISDTGHTRSTFAVQQFDIFLNKYWNSNLNMFVDLEFTLNYDSQNNWGSFALREAWINYEYSQQFNIKTGQFFPAFNNLNEIKNRLNLLNYIFRPIVYERLLTEILDPEDYIPERAFLQFHGVIPTKALFIDYAIYMGNSESSFLTDNERINNNLDYISGVDVNDLSKKLYGARVGVRTKHEHIKAGVSFTRDYNNGQNLLRPFESPITGDLETQNVQDQLRYRIGADLGINLYGFYLETEYILSEMEDFKIENENLNEIISSTKSWNQFYYATLHYDFLDDYFVYGGYSNISTEILSYISDASYFMFGGGIRATESITLKIQYINYRQDLKLPLFEEGLFRPGSSLNSDFVNQMFLVGFTTFF